VELKCQNQTHHSFYEPKVKSNNISIQSKCAARILHQRVSSEISTLNIGGQFFRLNECACPFFLNMTAGPSRIV